MMSNRPEQRTAAPPAAEKPADLGGLRTAYRAAYRAPEAEVLSHLIGRARLPHDAAQRIHVAAGTLVDGVRARRNGGGMESFLREYGLSTHEGIVLMCLAEALLRVPDAETANRLIADKIGGAEWDRHVGKSDSLFVNASTWALMLTGQLVQPRDKTARNLRGLMRQLVARGGEPVIRQAVTRAMRILGRQYVLGRTIGEALGRTGNGQGGGKGSAGTRYSFDMLGEAAKTAGDAERYFAAYAEAIGAIGAHRPSPNVYDAPGISVKLSALHPRFEYSQRPRVMAELSETLALLAVKARDAGIGMTIDAEESDRLDLTLDLFAMLLDEPALAGWDGLGLAVQAYQKRAYPVIEWLEALARAKGRRLMIRLVKGAYWDTEIKRAQEDALPDYPVFTRKAATDVSYLACARRMLEAPDAFYPQFATHNAHTLASVLEMAGASRRFEFQRLHGMGEALYAQIEGGPETNPPVRVYAPVGSHEELLPYLVRRLLENGANTSFVHHVADTDIPTEKLTADPVSKIERVAAAPNRRIPPPLDLHAPERAAAPGADLSDETVAGPLLARIDDALAEDWHAGPIVSGQVMDTAQRPVHSPADNRVRAGLVGESSAEHVDAAIGAAFDAASDWNATSADARAEILERAANLFQGSASRLIAMCIREAGKTLPDAVSEIREAVDYCRYYAVRARRDFGRPIELPGPTGESNQLGWRGRGVFACISPWNFPLAIFAGQVTAALAAGNAVIAKPAEQTPLIAAEAVRLLHQAGVPPDVLHLLPGPGEAVGARVVADPRIAGVAFTGATETARRINQSLANRPGAIVPLIAETGGQNAMIVDSTALPEQVVGDCITSAFQSAGQRCSALRVLFVQDEIAPRLLDMLRGAMDELIVGEPGRLSTDVGPIIDGAAAGMLKDHIARMEREGTILHRCAMPDDCGHGSYFPPHLVEIDGLERLHGEVFGPILHVIRYKAAALGEVVDAINRTGFGLTLGIHTRIDEKVEEIHRRTTAGNTYVNRNMIGAVVGVQPFGGHGLSGTGPKAGGPHYLHRFAAEETLTINTAAAGGNAALLAEDDDTD